MNARLALKKRPVARVLPVDLLEDDLALPEAVEHDRGRPAVRQRPAQHVPRRLARQEMPHLGHAPAVLDDGAVAENEGEGTGERLEDRPREVVASSGRERHLDAGVERAGDGRAVRSREMSVAVEKGAVDIEGEQTDH